MFCTKCGSRLDDDALFCTSCGESLNRGNTNSNNNASNYSKPEFNSPISTKDIKEHTFLSLSLFKNQLSAPKLLEEGLSYSKNLALLISLIVLLPLITVLLMVIGINLNSSPFGPSLPFSLILKIFIILVLFFGLLIFGTGGLMIAFTKGRLSFENVVRAATLPMINLFMFSLIAIVISLISSTIGSIVSLTGFLSFLFTYFNGVRYFSPESELLPISFSASFFITFFVSAWIMGSIIGEMFFRSIF
ncbi:MAG: zinc-ribbon domain-containing protein [Clostridium sp.]|uniref:zinc ribbon domain-containing protein n=1 Tax=Clostridium sp. TaxID=1506 RepID=UPI003F388B05